MVDTERRLAEFESICRERGLALTVQRRTILRELLGRLDHPTAEQVYEAVQDRLPGLSRTTVYRVLDKLVEIGAARKVLHPHAVARFDPTPDRHHHLVCEGCGQVIDVDASASPEIDLPDVGATGFKITDYSISFTGVCGHCQAG
jgi:Fur family peroxide stress response transcriptional regulator